MAPTITVSYSELDAYRQCPLKWHLAYQALWTREAVEGSPLSKGSLWHRVMQAHYETIQRLRVGRDGKFLEHPSRARQAEILWACQQAVAPLLFDSNGEQTEEQVLIAWMYEGHLEQYGIDEEWQILGVELAGRTRLLTERGGNSRFMLKFKVDLLVVDLVTRQVKVVDHKSASNFSRQAEIDIDDQFGLYSWATARQSGGKVKPVSVVRSDARTQRNKGPMRLEDRFRRIQTHRSDRELENIAIDAYRTAKMAYGSGALVHSSPAPDRCVWRCDFLEAHLAMRKGVAATDTIMRDFGFYQREAKHQEYTKQEGQD